MIWGTVDPVAAYLLSKGKVLIRAEAEAKATEYYDNLPSTLDPNDQLNAVFISDWVNEQFPRKREETVSLNSMSASLDRDFSNSSLNRWKVIPIIDGKYIKWLDPAGFHIATSEKPLEWKGNYINKFDFQLDINQLKVYPSLYLD